MVGQQTGFFREPPIFREWSFITGRGLGNLDPELQPPSCDAQKITTPLCYLPPGIGDFHEMDFGITKSAKLEFVHARTLVKLDQMTRNDSYLKENTYNT